MPLFPTDPDTGCLDPPAGRQTPLPGAPQLRPPRLRLPPCLQCLFPLLTEAAPEEREILAVFTWIPQRSGWERLGGAARMPVRGRAGRKVGEECVREQVASGARPVRGPACPGPSGS